MYVTILSSFLLMPQNGNNVKSAVCLKCDINVYFFTDAYVTLPVFFGQLHGVLCFSEYWIFLGFKSQKVLKISKLLTMILK